MKRFKECPQEKSVSRAIRAGGWTDDLREHAGTCRTCRDIVAVSGWMKQLSLKPGPRLEVPAAGQVWSKAQLLRQRKLVEGAIWAVSLFQMVALFFLASGLSIWIVSEWGTLREWFAVGVKPEWSQTLLLLRVSAFPLEFFIFILGACAATLIWTLSSMFAEE